MFLRPCLRDVICRVLFICGSYALTTVFLTTWEHENLFFLANAVFVSRRWHIHHARTACGSVSTETTHQWKNILQHTHRKPKRRLSSCTFLKHAVKRTGSYQVKCEWVFNKRQIKSVLWRHCLYLPIVFYYYYYWCVCLCNSVWFSPWCVGTSALLAFYSWTSQWQLNRNSNVMTILS